MKKIMIIMARKNPIVLALLLLALQLAVPPVVLAHDAGADENVVVSDSGNALNALGNLAAAKSSEHNDQLSEYYPHITMSIEKKEAEADLLKRWGQDRLPHKKGTQLNYRQWQEQNRRFRQYQLLERPKRQQESKDDEDVPIDFRRRPSNTYNENSNHRSGSRRRGLK